MSMVDDIHADEILVEEIVAAMRRLRAEGVKLNPGFPLQQCDCYGPPYVVVTWEGWVTMGDGSHGPHHECVLIEFPWDHTMHSIEEGADMARRCMDAEGLGKVYVRQDVICPTGQPGGSGKYAPWARHVDEGFSIEVWPDFTGKNER